MPDEHHLQHDAFMCHAPGACRDAAWKKNVKKKSWRLWANIPAQVPQTALSEEGTTTQIRLEETYTMRAIATTALMLENPPPPDRLTFLVFFSRCSQQVLVPWKQEEPWRRVLEVATVQAGGAVYSVCHTLQCAHRKGYSATSTSAAKYTLQFAHHKGHSVDCTPNLTICIS